MILPGLKHHFIASGGLVREPETGETYNTLGSNVPRRYCILNSGTLYAVWDPDHSAGIEFSSAFAPSVTVDGWTYWRGTLRFDYGDIKYYGIWRISN